MVGSNSCLSKGELRELAAKGLMTSEVQTEEIPTVPFTPKEHEIIAPQPTATLPNYCPSCGYKLKEL